MSSVLLLLLVVRRADNVLGPLLLPQVTSY